MVALRHCGEEVMSQEKQEVLFRIFTARCTIVQSAVLRSHVVCLVDCDHTGWNSSKIISRLVSLGCSLVATQTSRIYSEGNTRKFRRNRGGVRKKWLSAYKSCNISKTLQDRTKVTIEVE